MGFDLGRKFSFADWIRKNTEQWLAGFLQEYYTEKFCKIHRKAPISEYLFY